MLGIGETLREARMRQGIDITEVETRTKIRAKYLRALENEEFALLPGPTFVRSFLRTYGDYLGIDSSLLIEEFRARHESPDPLEPRQPIGAPPPRGRERQQRRSIGGPPSPGVLIVGAVVGILVILLIVGLSSDSGPGGGDKDETATEKARTSTQRTTPRRKRRERPAAPRRVTLKISPTAPTYVCIDRGEGTEPEIENSLAKAQTFRGKHLRVNLGRRSVKITANGKAVKITPGPTPVGFDFRPGKTRELPDGQRPCQ
ncbi:MAG: helix-turn-helix domain-containing protein [Thermoleophilaceae bacterium]|nr:helix-turn-helix domain-containing protein [Thermoleophilaceae bacterium]